jgi:hypothetical protein
MVLPLGLRHLGRPTGAKTANIVASLAFALCASSACTAVVQSGPLSARPAQGQQVFLSTGAAQRPYQTLGFVQATGFGNQVAGVVDIGDAQIDGTIKGALVNAAVKMGGDGIINIEFLDENPQTPAERAGDLVESLKANRQGRQEIKTRWRSVHAKGEVIRFL